MVHHGKTMETFGWKYASDEAAKTGNKKKTTYFKMAQTEPVARYYKNIWFLNGELVKYKQLDRKTNTVTLFVYDRRIDIQLPLQQWMKYRRMAFTPIEMAYVLRLSYMEFSSFARRCIKAGLIDRAKGFSPRGVYERVGNAHSRLYSEDSLFIMRSEMENVHQGHPRKDGKITSRAPSEQEVNAMIGRSVMLYTKNIEGELIPVWRNDID